MGGRGQQTRRAPPSLPGRPLPRLWGGGVGPRRRPGTGKSTRILGAPSAPSTRCGCGGTRQHPPSQPSTGCSCWEATGPPGSQSPRLGSGSTLVPTPPAGTRPWGSRRTGDQPPRLSSLHSGANGCASTVTSRSEGPGEGPPSVPSLVASSTGLGQTLRPGAQEAPGARSFPGEDQPPVPGCCSSVLSLQGQGTPLGEQPPKGGDFSLSSL